MMYNKAGLKCLLCVGFMLLGVLPVSADQLGRLFTTSDEREFINKYRSGYERISDDDVAMFKGIVAEEVKHTAVAEQPITVNGIVQRSSGPDTVWINGQAAQPGSKKNGGIQLRGAIGSDTSLFLKPKGGTHVVQLRPGQTWDPNGQRVVEDYQVEQVPAPSKSANQ